MTTAIRQAASISYLRPIRSESAPNRVKNGMAQISAIAMMMFAFLAGTSEWSAEEEREKLPGVPDHCLTGSGAEQGNQHALKIFPVAEGVSEGLVEFIPADFICVKMGDSFILKRIYSEMVTRMREIRNGGASPKAGSFWPWSVE